MDVISGQPNVDGWDAHMWYSDIGGTWQLATLPAAPHIDRIHAIAVTQVGFVALGLVLGPEEFFTQTLTSSDGHSWQLAGSYAGVGTDLAEINGRLIAFNDGNSRSDPMYSEDDGATWKVVDTETGVAVGNGFVGLLEADDYLWAVVSDDPTEDASIKTPVELWRTTDGLNWVRVAQLPDSISVNRAVMADGPSGWVIAARRTTFSGEGEQNNQWFAWRSSDALAWEPAATAPEYVGQIVADGQGFIAIGRDPGPCCALEESNVRQHIWTSGDGSTWHQQSQKGWHGREVDFITAVGDQVHGVGMDWLLGPSSGNFAWGVTWQVDRADLLD